MTGPRIGFIQGRLSSLIGGKIQAFPWPCWRDEFAAAAALGLRCMEWTIDDDRFGENPLMSPAGRAEILALAQAQGIAIPSLTADCLMQAPFWKAEGIARASRLQAFSRLLDACAALGIRIIVVPLVDHGSLTEFRQRDVLKAGLAGLTAKIRALGLMLAFESDFPPAELQAFIAQYPPDCFGINYDIGNSAGLGWDPKDEIKRLSSRIVNVHVKDRLPGGTTVALGQGAANLPQVFRLLIASEYQGDYILQTARAVDGDHAGTLAKYRDVVAALLAH